MARYEITDKTWLHLPDVGPCLFRPGQIISYDGIPNVAMRPLDDAAREAVATAAERKLEDPQRAALARIAELEAEIERAKEESK
jgi:hypothetical protein